MSAVDEILSQIPLAQLAGQLGVDEQTAEQATRQALPALLGGIQANTDDPGGASSFAQAVQQHDPNLVNGGVDLGQVDTAEGQKIVSHVFGANQGQVVNQLGALGTGGNDLIAKLLPILAPIVMSWLASKLTGGGAAAAPAGAPAGGGGIGDVLGGLLGSVLGGGGGGAAAPAGGIDIGSILGGLLGGGRK
ncbi:DUF937 domain-containing protein [Pseudonocardia sp. GCM10023141]|uniref:DUF937 domain-containing protein n=1 Tax=Pseudonocardia sp. GCM10023141 TaxID=3252653 RepID=UPI003606C056